MNIKKLKTSLLLSSRLTKVLIVSSVDYLVFLISIYLVLYFELSQKLPIPSLTFKPFVFSALTVSILYLLGVYRSLVRFINFTAIIELIRSLFLIFLFHSVIFIFFEYYHSLLIEFESYKDIILFWLLSAFLIVGIRLMANAFFSEEISSSKVIIYGAGSAGIQLASALRYSVEMTPIAFVDNDKSLNNTSVGGLKVLSPKSFEKILRRRKVDEVLIAMPSASRSTIQTILRDIEKFPVKVRALPGVAELAQGKVSVSELKEIQLEDLLGREKVLPNERLLNKNIKEKTVLVTGAGGSIGSEISRQVCRNNPSSIILFDSNEFSLYSISEELKIHFPDLKIVTVLGNITNEQRMNYVCNNFKVDTIYHSAAYKHVPIVEESPFEGVFNNIFGTLSCVKSAIANNVETFVFISTDKAVRPTNIMGASKRFAELILQAISHDTSDKEIKITMVRFGNVLGSSGSAVPLFSKQIETGGPVTVTHPEITRYFMTIPEAAELVIQAGALGKGGDVFVLDMGKPVKILELAKRMIRLSGMEIKDKENPDGDIEIAFTGLRPGEKLYEELLIGNNVSSTEHSKIWRAEEEYLSWNEIEKFLNRITKAQEGNDYNKLKEIFDKSVSGFVHDDKKQG